MAKQTKKPKQLDEVLVKNGAVGDSGFIPPAGQRKYYWVAITKVLTEQGNEDDPKRNTTHQCFTTKEDLEMFKANAEAIGMKKWELVWDPQPYL